MAPLLCDTYSIMAKRVATGSRISDKKNPLFGQDQRLLDVVVDLSNHLRAVSPSARVWLVGGFVRDALRGERPKDADVEVFGVAPETLEEVLQQQFPEAVNAVGKSFGIFKIRINDESDLDVAIPRRESKIGAGHRGFTVAGDPLMTTEEAAQRRDFTINALMADPQTGEILDHVGGVKDLHECVLRATNAERFQDDPLRVYRAMQFAARFGFGTASETLKLMCEMVRRGDLDELSHERITDEWKKMLLKSPRPSLGLEFARGLGIIEKYFPELQALIGTLQEAEWHPEGDVWVHTGMALDAAARIIREPQRQFSESEKLQVMLGTLCHDLGKPATTRKIEGRLRSRGHEEAGIVPTKIFFSRFAFGDEISFAVQKIAAEHLKPGELWKSMAKPAGAASRLDKKQYANAVRKLVKRIAPVSWRVLIAAAEADFRGRTIAGVAKDKYEAGEKFAKAAELAQQDFAVAKTLVRGRDIIAAAKKNGVAIEPGPRFREVITAIEDLRDEGKISTHEEALIELDRLLQN